MLITGMVVGILLALVLGGRPAHLLDVRLRAPILLFLAVIVRYGTELALRLDVQGVEQLRLPLFALGFGILLYGLWLNRDQPGLLVAGVGVAANAVAMIANGGWMPVWSGALSAAGMTAADLIPQFHRLLPDPTGINILLQAAPLGDILPIPFPVLRNVASVGDVFLSVGLGWFVFATLMGLNARAQVDGGRRPDLRRHLPRRAHRRGHPAGLPDLPHDLPQRHRHGPGVGRLRPDQGGHGGAAGRSARSWVTCASSRWSAWRWTRASPPSGSARR